MASKNHRKILGVGDQERRRQPGETTTRDSSTTGTTTWLRANASSGIGQNAPAQPEKSRPWSVASQLSDIRRDVSSRRQTIPGTPCCGSQEIRPETTVEAIPLIPTKQERSNRLRQAHRPWHCERRIKPGWASDISDPDSRRANLQLFNLDQARKPKWNCVENGSTVN